MAWDPGSYDGTIIPDVTSVASYQEHTDKMAR